MFYSKKCLTVLLVNTLQYTLIAIEVIKIKVSCVIKYLSSPLSKELLLNLKMRCYCEEKF